MTNSRKNRKCSCCKNYFPKETIKIKNGKNYCEQCYEKVQKESKELLELKDYIQKKLSPEDGDWPLIAKQIKQFKEEYGFKYSGMKATLQYLIEYENKSINLDVGIAIIQFYYKEAKNYFKKVYKLKETEDEYIERVLNMPPVEIIVNRSDIIQLDKEYQEKLRKLEKRELLNLDDVEDDGYIIDDF